MQALNSHSLAGVQLPSQNSRRPRRVSRAVQHVVRAAKTNNGPKVAIVGVTGAVGQEFLRVGRNEEMAICHDCTTYHPIMIKFAYIGYLYGL
jgi:hypothetical protein